MPLYTIAAAVEVVLEIRKSRFIGLILPVDHRAAALAEVQRLSIQHRAATHVCWALMAGGQSGMSDAGEPAGTAGRPMLEVLRHHQLDGVLAVVVRYYGGIKLGAGGLVRAYSEAVASALKLATVVERVLMAEVEITLPYADEAYLRYWLQQQNYLLLGSSHDQLAHLQVRLPAAALDQLRRALPRLLSDFSADSLKIHI